MTYKENVNSICSLTDRAFPPVIEQSIMIYDKLIPENELLAYVVKLAEEAKFPDIQIQKITVNGPGGRAITPAVSTRNHETGILITHRSDVFSTVSVLFRAINFGNLTLVAEYKCSDYEHKTQTISSCCGDTTQKSLTLKTTPQEIINGVLVAQRFSDGSHVDFNNEPGQAPNQTIARSELYHAFYFFCDRILFPKLKEYAENY